METNRLAVGILAHVDAGKTTLAEAILYHTGSIRKVGRVDHQDAFLDTYALEKERGITIFSKQALSIKGEGNCSFRYAGTCGFFGRNGKNSASAGLCRFGSQRR